MPLFNDGLLGIIGNSPANDENKPFPDCPVLCYVHPMACSECSVIKKKINDALERLENKDLVYSGYVIDPNAAPGGERECATCGAPASASDTECEYCGADLTDGRSPIRIRNASDLPNPAMEAQDLIFERRAVEKRYIKEKNSAAKGVLGTLVGIGMSLGSTMSGVDQKMSMTELQEMADSYGVSLYSYLKGLDAGQYLTKKGKANQDALEKVSDSINAINASRASIPTPTYTPGVGVGAGFAAGAASSGVKFADIAPKPPSAFQPAQTPNPTVEFMKRQAASYRPPQYSGGASSGCYNCTFYSADGQWCAQTDRSTNAGDSCGLWKLK